MQGSGPHVPERGWETRWIMQALDLGLHAPAAFLILLVSVISFGMALIGLRPFFPGPWGAVLLTSGAVALACAPVMMIHGALMQADGTGSLGAGQAIARARSLGVTAFLFTSAMLSMHVIFPRASGATPAPVSDLFQLILKIGLKPVLSIHVSLMIVNPICLALTAGIGFSAREATMASMRMIMRMTPVWLALMFGTTVAASALLRLPSVLAIPGSLILIAWTHVAAREIFGGIRQNGTSRLAVSQPGAA